jgi:AcrR family transcriptional regulator
LVEVAAEAFAAHGIDASLEEIARQAEVGVGTLYRHFPNRDALLEAVFRSNVDQLCDQADELLETLPPVDALGAWMRAFVGYVASKRGLATHLKSVVSHDAEIFSYSHSRMDAAISKLVTAAVDDGSIRAGVDPDDVLHAIGGVCMMADGDDWQEQACRISSLLMDGLRYGCDATTAKPAAGRRVAAV